MLKYILDLFQEKSRENGNVYNYVIKKVIFVKATFFIDKKFTLLYNNFMIFSEDMIMKRNKANKKIIVFLSVVVTLITLLGSIIVGFAGGAGDGKGILAYGLDVSSWQNAEQNIDWAKVKKAGKSFVIIRAGTTKGKDTYFEQNYDGARKAGLNIGCYFYTYATTVDGAKKDAQTLLSWLSGKVLEYPVYYDMENEVQLASGMTKDLRTKMIKAFFSEMKKAGWLVGTYANRNWFDNYLDEKSLGADDELWLASWYSSGTPSKDFSASYGLWQYTSSGSVDGIKGNVDLDVAYKDYPTLVKNGGYNGYKSEYTPVKELWKITDTEGVYVREGAGTSFKSVGSLKYGTEITVTGITTANGYKWGRILYNEKICWCAITYAKKVPVSLSGRSGTKCVVDNTRKIIYGLNPGINSIKNFVTVGAYGSINCTQTESGFGTGTRVDLIDTDGKTITDTYYIVVLGDANGDGFVDGYDYAVSKAVSNNEVSIPKNSPYFYAMNLKKDSTLDLYDELYFGLATNLEYTINQLSV